MPEFSVSYSLDLKSSLAHVMSLTLRHVHFSIGGLLCPFSDEGLDLVNRPKGGAANLDGFWKLAFLNHEPKLGF